MSDTNDFIPQKGNYRNLIAYQKAECIYDITFYFANTYLPKGDRTIDQMVQAARSGKQNIAEGAAASTTSSETELKLMNVAKASLQELMMDYEDYLRVRGKEQWQKGDEKFEQARAYCRSHSDSATYREAIKVRNDETIANIAIILIHQTDFLLKRLFDRLKEDFRKNGGIREEMTRARLEYRKNHPTKG
jgi:four helix bundle suffix protein